MNEYVFENGKSISSCEIIAITLQYVAG